MSCAHGMPTPASCIDCMDDGSLPPPEPESVAVLATWPARYPGQCTSCNLPVIPNQLVSRLSDGRVVHRECGR